VVVEPALKYGKNNSEGFGEGALCWWGPVPPSLNPALLLTRIGPLNTKTIYQMLFINVVENSTTFTKNNINHLFSLAET